MSEHGLVAKGARKAYRRHLNKSQYAKKENILKRVFSAEEKSTIGVGDIMLRYGCHQSMSIREIPLIML
jgi:hypothetical protein